MGQKLSTSCFKGIQVAAILRVVHMALIFIMRDHMR